MARKIEREMQSWIAGLILVASVVPSSAFIHGGTPKFAAHLGRKGLAVQRRPAPLTGMRDEDEGPAASSPW